MEASTSCFGVCPNNDTISKPIHFINQIIFPNYIIQPIIYQGSIIENIVSDILIQFPKPPSFFYKIKTAVFQNLQGQKIFQVLMDDINPKNTTSNIFYFVRSDNDDIIILDAIKLNKIGFLKNHFDNNIILKNQYFGALYALGYYNDEPIFTIVQLLINIDSNGNIESVLTGYALPIIEENYNNDITRTSFTASSNSWIGENFENIIGQSFQNPLILDIIYQPNPKIYTCAINNSN
jgi:hypothetical protein